jgi:hypothetical protein
MSANRYRDESTCRLDIVRRATEREDELVAVVLEAIFDELPVYGHARSAGELDDIRSGVRRSVELCLRVLAEGRRIDSDERVALHLTGGQRARQGIPKAVVLRSVTVATRTGYNFVVTCADQRDGFQGVTGALQELRTIIGWFEDDAVKALAEGHDEAFGQVLSAADRGEAILVDRLLEGRWHDDEELANHAGATGLHPSLGAHVVVVTAVDAIDERRMRATVACLRGATPVVVGPLRFGSRIHLPAIVQPRDGRAWSRLLLELDASARQHGVTAIHGDRVERLVGVSAAYKAIERGLPFVRAATERPGVVRSLIVRFHRVTSIGQPADRIELLDDVLGPILALPRTERDELLSTMDALYESGGSWASLGRTLGRHKNTVANRFARVLELTGLDIRKPAEWLVLETMLRLRFVAEADLRTVEHGDWRTDRSA